MVTPISNRLSADTTLNRHHHNVKPHWEGGIITQKHHYTLIARVECRNYTQEPSRIHTQYPLHTIIVLLPPSQPPPPLLPLHLIFTPLNPSASHFHIRTALFHLQRVEFQTTHSLSIHALLSLGGVSLCTQRSRRVLTEETGEEWLEEGTENDLSTTIRNCQQLSERSHSCRMPLTRSEEEPSRGPRRT
jgi:hypothetical protein